MLAAANDEALVRSLLFARDDAGRGSVHYAVAAGCVDVVDAMLLREPVRVARALLTADAAGWTPLHSAASGGFGALVRTILHRAADSDAARRLALDAVTAAGATPLHYGARTSVEVVRLLLDAGADVDGYVRARDGSRRPSPAPSTPLHRAIVAGRVDVARALLDAGASARARDAAGNNALHVAAIELQKPIVLMLLARRQALRLPLDARNGEEKSVDELTGGELDDLCRQADEMALKA